MADWVDNYHDEMPTQSMGCSVPEQLEQIPLLSDLYKRGMISQQSMLEALGVDKDFELSMIRAEEAKDG